jgi:hypothetical protein
MQDPDIYIDDNHFIFTRYVGTFPKELMFERVEKALVMSAEMRTQGLPVLILIDITANESYSRDIQEAGVDAVNRLDFDRMAIFGKGNAFIRHLVNFVLAVTGKSDRVRYFDSQAAATLWLRDGLRKFVPE